MKYLGAKYKCNRGITVDVWNLSSNKTFTGSGPRSRTPMRLAGSKLTD